MRTGAKVMQGLRNSFGVDKRNGRAAVRARTFGLQVDGCSALRAVDLTHGRTQLGELVGRGRPNEVLLGKKLVEGDELPVVVLAAPKGKARGALQVVGKCERLVTTWAVKICRQRVLGDANLSDPLEQS